MARAATSTELTRYRTRGKATRLRAAIFTPTTIYTARINQTFPSFDGVLEITYDGGSGTLSDVLADMTLLIGSSAGAHDVGIVRIRSVDSTKFYIGETSDVEFADNQYLTVIDDFGLWARHVLIDDGEAFMDGGIEYSDQHSDYDPVPIMGGNRILKLTGATVSTTFDFSDSYVIDSTVTGYSCSAPGSSSSSGMTTATPTITWNSVGWKKVYLTLTAANGKTYLAVRYVYIWNDDNLPPRVLLSPDACREDAEEGGWSFDITLLDDCDLDTIRDHALVILFGEDYFGNVQDDIGPLAGCENIYTTGWVARETIDWNPEQGSVRFTAYGAHYWFGQIPSYPDGVELVSRPSAAWTEIQGLTVRKGLYHFLRWRTTAMRIMDMFLPDDTKYTKEVSSLAQNLWEQIREMAFLQIFARAGVNAQGQLFIEVHPQLVPEADRDWPTVMTITKADWVGKIELERVTKNEVSQLSLSGVAVNESGRGTPFFAISPGHTFPHYGRPELQENLLVSSQADTIQKAGLYYGWRNNPYPNIPITMAAAVRLIDCFPRQKCEIDIAAEDTVRGIEYSGGLIPRSITLVQNPETGYVHSEVAFEGETFEALAVKEEVPGSTEPSNPPLPPLPPLPPPPVIIPGVITPTEEGGPPKVILHDLTKGLLYTENFHEDSPNWITINAGLTEAQYQGINRIVLTPDGQLYVAALIATPGTPFIAYAPSPGSTFTIIEDSTTIAEKFTGSTITAAIALGLNPLTGQVAYVIGGQPPFPNPSDQKIYVGSGVSFAEGVSIPIMLGSRGSLSAGQNAWRLSGQEGGNGKLWVISLDGATIVNSVGGLGVYAHQHVAISTTEELFHVPYIEGHIVHADGNGLTNLTNRGSLLNLPIGTTDLPDNVLASDETGMFLMARWDVGARGKSSDGGATWSGIPTLLFGGDYAFAYAGTNEEGSRWIAARGVVYYSPDFGNTAWVNKQGNITLVTPFPNINIVKVVEY